MTPSKYKAHEILNWVESACHDMADSNEALDAEELFESEDTVYDLLIQKVHDESKSSVDLAIGIFKQMLVISDHEVIKKCCVKALNRMER